LYLPPTSTGFVAMDRERDPGAQTEVDDAAANGNGPVNANGPHTKMNGLQLYAPRRRTWPRSDGEPSASRHWSDRGEPGADSMSDVASDGTAPDRTSVNFVVSASLTRMLLGWEGGEMDVDGFLNGAGSGGGSGGAHDRLDLDTPFAMDFGDQQH